MARYELSTKPQVEGPAVDLSFTSLMLALGNASAGRSLLEVRGALFLGRTPTDDQGGYESTALLDGGVNLIQVFARLGLISAAAKPHPESSSLLGQAAMKPDADTILLAMCQEELGPPNIEATEFQQADIRVRFRGAADFTLGLKEKYEMVETGQDRDGRPVRGRQLSQMRRAGDAQFKFDLIGRLGWERAEVLGGHTGMIRGVLGDGEPYFLMANVASLPEGANAQALVTAMLAGGLG